MGPDGLCDEAFEADVEVATSNCRGGGQHTFLHLVGVSPYRNENPKDGG